MRLRQVCESLKQGRIRSVTGLLRRIKLLTSYEVTTDRFVNDDLGMPELSEL